jgi:hypothetical protein
MWEIGIRRCGGEKMSGKNTGSPGFPCKDERNLLETGFPTYRCESRGGHEQDVYFSRVTRSEK